MLTRVVDDGAAGVLYVVGVMALLASALISIVSLISAVRDY